MPDIQKLRNDTYKEAVRLLKRYKKAVIIRPTGYGKTGLLTKILSGYQKTIYLYPAEIVRDAVLLFYYHDQNKIPEDRSIDGVIFLSYAMLAQIAADTEKYASLLESFHDCDLIIADECHKLGAKGAGRGLEILIEYAPNVHLLGATATPERMDTIDEIARYFDNRMVSEYTLHDAFKDGILQKPYYYYCNYSKATDDLDKELKKARKEIDLCCPDDQKLLREHLSFTMIQIANLHNMPYIIKKACDEHAPDTDYMRFIAFFTNFKETKENGEKLQKWVASAFPDHNIRITYVTSETDETSENAKLLKSMDSPEKTIDLVYSCNMLNMGYHIDSLTGIFMYRGTHSGIIYTQQLGRILSTGTSLPGICFDIVDNIHIESMYSLLGRRTADYTWRERRAKELVHKKQMWDAYQAFLTSRLTEDDLSLRYEALSQNDIISILLGKTKPEPFIPADEAELKNLNVSLKKKRPSRARSLPPKDLIAISTEATYRDLIRKTVAEAKAMRCRQAWAEWLEQGGIAMAKNGRPLSRAQVLAQTPPENIPLPPFCYAKQVSVEAVLQEMGL